MKTKLITQEPTFRPITIELTIESQEELEEWYARCNVSARELSQSGCGYRGHKIKATLASSEMFSLLEHVIRSND